MGIKNFFKTKPPTQEETENKMRDHMLDKFLPVKNQEAKKPNNFAAYSEYANDKTKKKKEYAPKGYSKVEKEEAERLESEKEARINGNPYEDLNSNTSQSKESNPYANNPYSSNPYQPRSSSSDHSVKTPQSSNPYQEQPYRGNINPYQSRNNSSNTNPYAKNTSTQQSQEVQDPTSFSFEPVSRTQTNMSQQTKPQQQQQLQQQQLIREEDEQYNYDDEDLNDTNYNEEEDFNEISYQEEIPEEIEETEEERVQREEDEEVEKIKNQIRFTKQESVASTRNTLRMAREAEESGKNTMGMLGAQSEALYNVERNLSLAETQQRLAKEKTQQLHHYNRNIMKPSVKNPFTKSKRLREREEKIKNDRIASKIEAERTRSELTNSTQRIKASIDDSEKLSDSVSARYRRDKIAKEAKLYQFEQDSEDDEMEQEIGENIDEIGKISNRLKKLAMSQGDEIERQSYRLKDTEEKSDRLDINLHVNTASLSRY